MTTDRRIRMVSEKSPAETLVDGGVRSDLSGARESANESRAVSENSLRILDHDWGLLRDGASSGSDKHSDRHSIAGYEPRRCLERKGRWARCPSLYDRSTLPWLSRSAILIIAHSILASRTAPFHFNDTAILRNRRPAYRLL